MRSKGKGLSTLLLAFLERNAKTILQASVTFAFLVFVILACQYAMYRAERSVMTPSELAERKRFFEEPVQLPPSWRDVKPFPQDIVGRVSVLKDEWDSLRESEPVQFAEPVRKDKEVVILKNDWPVIERWLQESACWLEEAALLVAEPSYELAVSPNLVLSPTKEELLASCWVRTFRLKAIELARAKKFPEAFDAIMPILQTARRHPVSTVDIHFEAYDYERLASSLLADLARDCPDADLISEVLKKVNGYDSFIDLKVLDRSDLVDVVGKLRDDVRRGVTVDLDSKRPGGYFLKQWVKIRVKEHSNKVHRSTPFNIHLPFLSDMECRALYCCQVSHGCRSAFEKLSKARFDLSRIALASRIAEIRTGKKPTSLEPLFAYGIPKDLLDPFSGKPYLWDDGMGIFYSVWVDGNDPKGLIRCESTYMTMNSGETILLR